MRRRCGRVARARGGLKGCAQCAGRAAWEVPAAAAVGGGTEAVVTELLQEAGHRVGPPPPHSARVRKAPRGSRHGVVVVVAAAAQGRGGARDVGQTGAGQDPRRREEARVRHLATGSAACEHVPRWGPPPPPPPPRSTRSQ